jgi:2-dehydropantoate 2-reductase
MNIVVLGAGAVGGYFGGRLASTGTPVTFLVRERRYQQLREHGLNVHSVHGDFTLTPRLALSVTEIENPDIVIVAVKNYHLNHALPEIRCLVEKGAVVLPLLNGVQHMDLLVSEFGQESVLGGVCYIEATLDSNGNIIHTSPMHDVVFGPLTSIESLTSVHQQLLNDLETAFKVSGVNVRLSQSIMVDIWQKFVFLTSFSGVTAATRKPIGEILNDAVSFEFFQDMIREIVQVAEARQVQLPPNTFEQIMNQLKRVSPTMTSSLHRDLEKGLPLEIDSLQGTVLDMAAQFNLSTPCTRSVYALLHPYKEGVVRTSQG